MRSWLKHNVAFLIMILIGRLVSALQAEDWRASIDPLAKQLVDNGYAVGLVVGIYQNGETQVLGYGETKKGSGAVPDGDTIYEIGSVSKVFTSLLLAEMVNAGVMKLDDPVQTYLPEGVKMPIKDDQPITLLHLATHTSGLPRMPDNFAPADPKNPYADYTKERMYAFLSGYHLERAPGKFEYSNLGAGLLGHLLANHEGTSYEQLLVERISKPLNMADTRITLSEEELNRLAPPYNAELKPDKNWDHPAFPGAGGIRSTVNDLFKFVDANLKHDSTPLSEAMQLTQQRQPLPKDGQPMGLAWHFVPDGQTRMHSGMTGGYAAWLTITPGRNLGVIVLANTATETIPKLGESVTRVVLGLKVDPPKQRKPIDVDPAVLASYAGVYAITPEFALKVTVEDGNLMVQATAQEKFQVSAESPTDFFYKVVDAQITFVPSADGKVDKLILHQNGRDLTGTRKE